MKNIAAIKHRFFVFGKLMFTLEEKSKALYDTRRMKLLLSPETGGKKCFFIKRMPKCKKYR